MILDSHVYCFEPADTPAGHASAEAHLKWVQASQAGHHQPAFRIRDRAPAASRDLNPGGAFDLDRLPDVNFRVDHERGRVVWTIDGEDCTKHFYPPNLRNVEFTTHSLISEMDYAGVDVALLHTDPMLGRDVAFQAACIAAYPQRLRSMAPVDEWRIPGESNAVINELTDAIQSKGLHAIKFISSLAYLAGAEPWDHGPYRPFWEAATTLAVPVFFTLDSGPGEMVRNPSVAELRDGYVSELSIVSRWIERYPHMVCSLTHGFPWRLFLEGDAIVLPEAIWEVFANPNVNMEVCFPVRLGDLFDFPYRAVWPVLEQMIERIGSDHLLWGTDMPFQNRFCTYRQSRDWIEKYCAFLEPSDLAAIMGGTAARILGLND